VFVLMMGGNYEVCLRWHGIHAKFHINQLRNSSNIKGITSTVCKTIVLVLLMGGVYDVHHWDGL
jgi:hypothetical protein